MCAKVKQLKKIYEQKPTLVSKNIVLVSPVLHSEEKISTANQYQKYKNIFTPNQIQLLDASFALKRQSHKTGTIADIGVLPETCHLPH